MESVGVEGTKHYEQVCNSLMRGRLVPLLGAGVNLAGRPPGAKWIASDASCLPSGSELATYLAYRHGFRQQGALDLLHVSEYIADRFGTNILYHELRTLLEPEFPPTAVHELLAGLPERLRRAGCIYPCPLLITTNYDDVLERQFHNRGEPFDTIVYQNKGRSAGRFVHQAFRGHETVIDEPNNYLLPTPRERTVILKIHGGISRTDACADSFIISTTDYTEFLTRGEISSFLPVTIAATLRRARLLFLGYSLGDLNIRVLLKRLLPRTAAHSWGVQFNPEQPRKSTKAGVEILNVDLNSYIAGLSRCLPRPNGNLSNGGL